MGTILTPEGWRALPRHCCVYIRALDDNGQPGKWIYNGASGDSQFTGWCGKPTSYRMVRDDDENLVRKVC